MVPEARYEFRTELNRPFSTTSPAGPDRYTGDSGKPRENDPNRNKGKGIRGPVRLVIYLHSSRFRHHYKPVLPLCSWQFMEATARDE